MLSKISKNLLLCSVLGALLFASAVPTAEAFPKPRAKASHLEKGKLHGWLGKHWNKAVIAMGVGVIGVCGLQYCQPINNTKVAQSLTSETLPDLYDKLSRGEEEESLVYYVAHDDETRETRIGWLHNELISPYIPDKYSIHHLTNHLPFLSKKDLVSNVHIIGTLLPSAYPLEAVTFFSAGRNYVNGAVVATISSSSLSSKKYYLPTNYVVLVTHHAGEELDPDDRYFTFMPESSDEYGKPPLTPRFFASTRGLIGNLRRETFGREPIEQQIKQQIEIIRSSGVIEKDLSTAELDAKANRGSGAGLNEEVAQSLVDNTLAQLIHTELHFPPSMSEEDKSLFGEIKLVYYVANDGKAKVGWLASNDINANVLSYDPDYKDVDFNGNIVTKDSIHDYIIFLMKNKTSPIYETVSSDALAGKLSSIGSPMRELTFSNEDGQVLSGNVFAQIIPLEVKSFAEDQPPYAVLVTHHDGQELEADDKYFTIMTDELPWIKKLRDNNYREVDQIPDSLSSLINPDYRATVRVSATSFISTSRVPLKSK